MAVPEDPGTPDPSFDPASSQPLDFAEVLESGQVFSREEVTAKTPPTSQEYDPVSQTTGFMHRAVKVEEAWETILRTAREQLFAVDARQLYLDFLDDLKGQVEAGSPRAPIITKLL